MHERDEEIRTEVGTWGGDTSSRGRVRTPATREWDAAARRGAHRGVTGAAAEGRAVTSERREAAVRGAVAAAAESHDATADAIEAATEGAVHGALRRRTAARPEEIRAAVQGAAAGALAAASTAPDVDRAVIVAAAKGAAEGALAGLDELSGGHDTRPAADGNGR